MPVKVKCNSCGLELQAPDDLVGKHATCPKCRTRLPVGTGSITQSTVVAMKAPPTPPPAPPSKPGRASVEASADEIASFLEPPPGEVANTSSRESVGSLTASPQVAVAPPPPSPTTSTQSAKFIIADATARRIELGAGGQLPRLVLDEAKKKEEPEETSGGSKTWILLAAVGGSVLLSVGLLLFDAAGGGAEPNDKGKARRKLEERYVKQLLPSKPCQPYLARAIQAYNRRDFTEERRLYHHVLDMLHSEGKDPIEGVTGAVNTASDTMPNDIELEELLSTLLRE